MIYSPMALRAAAAPDNPTNDIRCQVLSNGSVKGFMKTDSRGTRHK